MDVVVRARAARSAKETATEDVRATARIYCAETIVIAARGKTTLFCTVSGQKSFFCDQSLHPPSWFSRDNLEIFCRIFQVLSFGQHMRNS